MRLISQYKNLILTNKIFSPCSLKILKFHRTKWKKIQKLLKYFKKNSFKKNYEYKLKHFSLKFKKSKKLTFYLFKKKKKKKFLRFKKRNVFNNLLSRTILKRWYKLRRRHFNDLQLKRVVSQIFDNSIKNSFFKKEINKNKSLKLFTKQFKKVFIQPLFKINILLTKLFFFKNIYQANQLLFSNKILLNNKPSNPNEILKKGDIIRFNCLPPQILLVLKSSSRYLYFFNFLEIDQYSKTIVILKDFNSLSDSDTHLIYKNYLNLKSFSDYFK
jgi:hypothetical protein